MGNLQYILIDTVEFPKKWMIGRRNSFFTSKESGICKIN
jgi:predicted DNA-binding transcriptional regulator AlpA